MKLYSVIFKDNGKDYYFNGDDNLKKGDYVIVETERGEKKMKKHIKNAKN